MLPQCQRSFFERAASPWQGDGQKVAGAVPASKNGLSASLLKVRFKYLWEQMHGLQINEDIAQQEEPAENNIAEKILVWYTDRAGVRGGRVQTGI